MSAPLHSLLVHVTSTREPRLLSILLCVSGGSLIVGILAATLTNEPVWWVLALAALFMLAGATITIFTKGIGSRQRFVELSVRSGATKDEAERYWDAFDWKSHGPRGEV